ncbi:hypothetical protein RHGRI_004463 [Rhododendron griersonianum]|uniref:Uncharacterized protein n=1 Tax=Rhododendron griersonianum TaxID=479676 RepID=A0AAV6LBN2_9ERIC|nr:hypothetical protein RHGRI_004463 [Rhododendron griersonianum]
MIDTLQRLSIDCLFQEEIEALLQKQYMESTISNGYPEFDLYEVSTRFRLLRQEGYNVPADVFNNFKNKEGRFKSELGTDIKGLMALYEASHLSIKGEDKLDQAANYSCLLLDGWMMNLDQRQARLVDSTLRHPYHKNLARFTARSFVSDYKGINGWVDGLQELATMDFKMVQSTNQREILQFSEWWKDMGLANDLKFARNETLKWYMRPMAALTNPRFSQQRVELTKPISLIYIIDDIFYVYGTLEELTLFTEAVDRWDLAAVENLPYYMKSCFNALYDTTNEIAYKIYKAHGWNPIDSLQKTVHNILPANFYIRMSKALLLTNSHVVAVGKFVQCFLSRNKMVCFWAVAKHMRVSETAVVSSGVHVVLVHTFFLLGNGITRKTVDLVNDNPGVITSVATILRLWDDLGNGKGEFNVKHEQKVKEVRSVLRKVGENPLECLVMIDTLQRLSIDYHFQEDIEAFLQKQYMESNISNGYREFDLYEVSTRFRLLRQEGYNVPADVFNHFKNKEGRFKSELSRDIKGLMALYEASHLSIKGEDILDQAADYSCLLLDGWMMNLDQRQARLVDSTLRHPYHKNLARFTARNFISDYKGINGWVDGLQELATMDFKMVQSTNQREILQFSD